MIKFSKFKLDEVQQEARIKFIMESGFTRDEATTLCDHATIITDKCMTSIEEDVERVCVREHDRTALQGIIFKMLTATTKIGLEALIAESLINMIRRQ